MTAALLAALLLGAAPADAGPSLRLIEGRAAWSGTVTVDGVVVVGPEGELAIAPGTVVRFVPRDQDADGIGDSELRVEGRLLVEGEPGRPVLFTSAAPRPRPADWKYVMVNHAREAVVRDAVFEYAFSGVQVHYTRALFERIVCRRNVDGFRFSTAPVVLRDSLLAENEHGIRFEERGAGAVVEGNLLTGNRFGIFAVVKCRGLTRFAGNAIEGNSVYAVKLGQEQAEDLPLQGNWWGTVEPAAIADGLFDGRREAGLGRVLFDPPLATRPALRAPAPPIEAPRTEE